METSLYDYKLEIKIFIFESVLSVVMLMNFLSKSDNVTLYITGYLVSIVSLMHLGFMSPWIIHNWIENYQSRGMNQAFYWLRLADSMLMLALSLRNGRIYYVWELHLICLSGLSPSYK